MAAGSAPSLRAPTRPLSSSPLPGRLRDPLPVPPCLPLCPACGKGTAAAAGSSAPRGVLWAARAAAPAGVGWGRTGRPRGRRADLCQCPRAGTSVGHGWPPAAAGGAVPAAPAAPAARLRLVSLLLSRRFPAEVTGSTLGPRCRCGSPPCQLGRFPVQKN